MKVKRFLKLASATILSGLALNANAQQQFSGPMDFTSPISRTGETTLGNTLISGTNSLYISGKTDLNNRGMRFVHAGGNNYFDSSLPLGSNALIFRLNTSNGGMERMRITADGKVGIGFNGTNPTYNFEVKAPTDPVLQVTNGNAGIRLAVATLNQAYSGFAIPGDGLLSSGWGGTENLLIHSNKPGKSIKFITNDVSGTWENLAMQINYDGKIRIGDVGSMTTPGDYKLYVSNGILTEKVKVAIKSTSNWADYVFAENYKLTPLSEVEAFIKENKHLPEVPSAQEVVDNGIDVAQMDAILLKKVEELTLHMIELQKQNELLKSRIQTLEKK